MLVLRYLISHSQHFGTEASHLYCWGSALTHHCLNHSLFVQHLDAACWLVLLQVRANKGEHLRRIGEVIGLVFLVGLCGFFFAATAGSCLPMPETWWVPGAGSGCLGWQGASITLCNEQVHMVFSSL
jgi:hypothetical protein